MPWPSRITIHHTELQGLLGLPLLHSGASIVNQDPHVFENTSLESATFKDVNLASARFEDVNLASASFSNVSLAGAQFADINFSEVSISDSNLEGMSINGILVSDLLRAYRP